MTLWDAIILAIVEGITEYLPISSTGHMILASAFMGLESTPFTKLFIVNIQLGAIVSVLVLYYKRFFQGFDFYLKLFVAFLPAAAIGFLLGDFIDGLLENVTVVAITLILGGIVLLFADQWFNPTKPDNEISWLKALKIGFFQCIALVPGVSRSGATIIGGMVNQLDRKTAAEFSFFLAVPTMLAATGYKLLKSYKILESSHISLLLVGNVVAFIVAMVAIKFFIGILTKYGFKFFGYYRIILGGAILILMALGIDLKIE